ncbi:MAG: DUF3047 domain-containing protein [wastewater metagenome]|nr:DUF3047 domain-containing protein [Candidatus Loosdrechtia aerotolerans]
MEVRLSMRTALFLLLFIVLVTETSQYCFAEKTIVIDDFEDGLKPQWKERKLSGKTRYSIVRIENGHALKVQSHNSASGLTYRYKYSLTEYPILTWKWKIENTIKQGNLMEKKRGDCAARVYVIFPSWVLFLTKSISYVWANKLPEGHYIPSPFHSQTIIVAVESGEKNVGKWVTERRNIYEDYKAIFRREPPHAGGIAVMTDTDNTGGHAVACYDDIKIEKP